MADIKDILMVCTGNSCRSPFAEYLLRDRLDGVDVTVSSAGTHAPEGMEAPTEVLEAAQEFGLDLTDHRARQLKQTMIDRADVVLVMTPEHLNILRQWAPEARDKIMLITQYGAHPRSASIPDPIGQPLEVYHDVFDLLADEIDAIAEKLKSDTEQTRKR